VLDLLPTDAASFNNPAVMDSIFFDSSTKADTLQSYQVQFYDSFSCSSVIEGWADILQQMHIGDTWLVAIPWQAGYGQAGSTSGGTIDPYSSLFFRIQLCDITWWGGTLETSY
jgi:FKBP-type peptidyl-prolyl cis-trans isomerase